MRRSAAYLDYLERFRQVSALLGVSLESVDPLLAGAAAKGAIVLAAAAVERYMNDSLRQACQRLRVTDYSELSEAQQSYLCSQIAKRIGSFLSDNGDYRHFNANRRTSLRSAVDECFSAFNDPSSWPHIPEFGLFLDGAAAPNKISAVLRDFDPNNDDVFSPLETRAIGKAMALNALTQLVDARHDAAHAKSHSMPSPSDAKAWIVNSIWIVRLVESFLMRASPIPEEREERSQVHLFVADN